MFIVGQAPLTIDLSVHAWFGLPGPVVAAILPTSLRHLSASLPANHGTGSTLGYTAVARHNEHAWVGARADLLRDYLTDLALLFAAYVVAVHHRRSLPFGSRTALEGWWHDPMPLVVIGLALAITHAARVPLKTSRNGRFLAPLSAVALAAIGLSIAPEHYSRLLTIYFAGTALLFVALVVPLPGAWTIAAEQHGLGASVRKLWARRGLLRLWVLFNVRSRYAQTALGLLWVILLPLASALVMSLVFSRLMRAPVGNVPFIAFLLAGLTPWNFFRQCLGNSSRALVTSMGLMNQVYFPREIIVLATLGEALVDMSVMFGTMLVVNAIVGIWPNPWFVFLPVIILVQTIFMLGLMLILAWLGALIRDVPNLVQLALQIIFYLCAVIYPAKIVPTNYRWLITINPIAVLITAYRDIIVYDHAPNWLSLFYPAAFGVVILVYGYRLFKTKEDNVADLL